MEVSEKKFINYIKDCLSQVKYFPCVISYDNNEDLAWYTALRIGEIITEYFESKLSKQIDTHLNFKIEKIILKLNEMGENDILLLSINDVNIKSLKSYILSETNGKKKNLIFISNEENPIMRPFKDITGNFIKVNSLNKNILDCVIDISEKGEREFKLKLPDKSLVNKYHKLKVALLKETIRKQVPELDNHKF